MKKNVIKQIRGIASRLPTVYEQHMSGGLWDKDETGKEEFIPNIYNVEINHERRIRHAYERLGMEGVKKYLEMIHNLQKDRHEKAFGNTSSRETVPVPDQVDPVGDNDILEDNVKDAGPAE